MTALTYRPDDALLKRARAAAVREAVSFQAFLDRAVVAYLDGAEHDVDAIAASIIERNRLALDKVAVL